MKVKQVQQLHQATPLLASVLEKLDGFAANRAKRSREPEGGVVAAPLIIGETDSLLEGELDNGLQALGDSLLEFRHQLAPSAELVAKRLISLLPSSTGAQCCRHRAQLWRCIAIFCAIHGAAGSRVLSEAIDVVLASDRSGSGGLLSYVGEESLTAFGDALLASAAYLKSSVVQGLSHVVVRELVHDEFPPQGLAAAAAVPLSLLSEHVEEVAHLTVALILSCRPLVPSLLALGNRIVERCLACRECPVGASARAKVSLLQAVLRCVTLPDALPWYTSSVGDVEGVVNGLPSGMGSSSAFGAQERKDASALAQHRARGLSASPRLRPLGPEETTIALRRSTPTMKPVSVVVPAGPSSSKATETPAALKPTSNPLCTTSTPRTTVVHRRPEDASDIPDIVLD